MEKKEYIKPTTEVIYMMTTRILCDSSDLWDQDLWDDAFAHIPGKDYSDKSFS